MTRRYDDPDYRSRPSRSYEQRGPDEIYGRYRGRSQDWDPEDSFRREYNWSRGDEGGGYRTSFEGREDDERGWRSRESGRGGESSGYRSQRMGEEYPGSSDWSRYSTNNPPSRSEERYSRGEPWQGHGEEWIRSYGQGSGMGWQGGRGSQGMGGSWQGGYGGSDQQGGYWQGSGQGGGYQSGYWPSGQGGGYQRGYWPSGQGGGYQAGYSPSGGYQSGSWQGGESGWRGGSHQGGQGGQWLQGGQWQSGQGMEGSFRGRGQNYRGRGPKGYHRSDDRIREDVNDCLTEDASIDASGIEVEVSSGEVTLKGTVSDRRSRRVAEDLVEEIAGVTHVQNNLRLEKQSDEKSEEGSSSNTARTASSTSTTGSSSTGSSQSQYGSLSGSRPSTSTPKN